MAIQKYLQTNRMLTITIQSHRTIKAFLATVMIVSVSLIIFFNNTTGYLAADMSFLVNLIFLFLVLYFHLNDKSPSLFNSVFVVFFYTFFWLAPVLQSKSMHYPNTMGFSEELVVRTNILLLLFGITYSIGRCYFQIKNKHRNILYNKQIISKGVAILYFLIILLTLIFFGKSLLNVMIVRENILSFESSVTLIIKKFLFYMPLFLVYYVLLDKKIKKKWHRILLFLVSD